MHEHERVESAVASFAGFVIDRTRASNRDGQSLKTLRLRTRVPKQPSKQV